MATFKVVVFRKRADGFYSVFIRITQNRRKTHVKTDKVVSDKGLVKGTKEVRDSFVLSSCMSTINEWVERLNKVDSKDWTVEQVRSFLETSSEDICFSDFARTYIQGLYKKLQATSVKQYYAALKHIEKYAGTDKIMFSMMTTTFVSAWVDSLIDNPSARSCYPLMIKRIFNEAVKIYNDYDSGVSLIKNNPWLKVKIERTRVPDKRAITMEECRAFFALSPDNPRLQLAIDVCKMILCLAGINAADLYKMQKSEYYDGILHYERRKTRTHRTDRAYIEMRVPDMLLPTFEKYFAEKEDPYLFTFHDMYSSGQSFDTNLCTFMVTLCKEYLGMVDAKHYTPYTFRHSWATIAQNDVGAGYGEIAFAMNHVSAHKVTMGYVKPDFSRAWELNEKVVEKVFFTNEPSRRTQKYHVPEFDKVEDTFELSADAYFMGEVVAHIEGKGYRNTDEIIEQLMDNINATVPKNCTIQIKVKNITKNQTKYFERKRDIK